MKIIELQKRIEATQDALRELNATGQAIFNAATAEDRDPTGEELARAEKAQAGFQEKFKLLETLQEQKRQSSIVNEEDDLSVCIDKTVGPSAGFQNLGEFAQAIYQSGKPGQMMDQRLSVTAAAATTFGSAGVGADGGFLIPTEFSQEVRSHMIGGEGLLELTDQVPVTGNSMTFPSDETTPWGTTGVIAYWANEAATVTQTKAKLGERTLKLNKLMALVPATDELLADTAALDAYLGRKMAEAINWKVNDSIINGLGAGQPLGIFNAGALVSQAKVGSQTADTINATNIGAMYGRLSRSNNPNLRWLINPDSFNQLIIMTLGDQPIFTPPVQGIKQAPNGSLLGIPIILSETTQTLGDKGDIFLCDFSQYATITKAGGIQTAVSVHLFFDYDEVAFRATFRLDGQPWNVSAFTPPNSALTRSGFVTLDARA